MARCTYYSRAGGYSRSYRAEVAEEEGRLPRTRAARELGVSVRAFDAACRAVGYRPDEWHHVGRYAAKVDYYDLPTLRANPDFMAALIAASSPTKRRQLAAAATCERFRGLYRRWCDMQENITRNLTCRGPLRIDNDNWRKLHDRLLRESGLWAENEAVPDVWYDVAVGDVAALRARVAQKIAETAAQRETRARNIARLGELLGRMTEARDDFGRKRFVFSAPGAASVNVLIHDGGINVGPKWGCNLKISEAVRVLEQVLPPATV